MNTIRFKSEATNEIEFGKVLGKRVRAYFKENNISKYGGWVMYFKSFVMLSLYFVPFILLLTLNIQPWVAFLFVVIMGFGEAGIGMSVMHDATHGAYSKKTWVNSLAASSMFLLGSNTINWRIQHNLNHHSYTNIYNYDPDISTKAVIRLCDHAPVKGYMRFQQFYAFFLYGFMTFLKLFSEINIMIGYNREGVTQQMGANPKAELWKLILTKIIYLTFFISLPLIFTEYSIWQILLGFFIMHFVAGMIMSTVFQMAHVVMGVYQPLPKNGVINCERLAHQLKSSSDFGQRSGLLSWYIGGLDFQVEHHLFPTICHIHYAALAPIVEKTATEFGLKYNSNRTFAHALVSHFNRLKELGRTNYNPIIS